jgi:ABC-2 type transport system permease protein
MTTAIDTPTNPATATGPARRPTTPADRVRALGRAEFTLLRRNRTALAIALLMPVAMVASFRPLVSTIPLRGTGLDAATLTTSGGIGFVLVFVVYYNLVTTYVARREELVLKRLRTGEAGDLEILGGAALPAALLALLQCAVLVLSGTLLLHGGLPRRPDLLLLGLLLGVVLSVALAALSTLITRTVEIAQLTTTPLVLLSTVGAGLLVPLQSLPHPLAQACRALPMTPVAELIQAGLHGGTHSGAGRVAADLALALAWTAATVFAVRRRFRWEPRR